MARQRDPKTKPQLYQAPPLMLAAFYGILLVWSMICLSLMNSMFTEWGWSGGLQVFIIGFLLMSGWYFSLAISYSLEQSDREEILLKSPRRTLRAKAGDIALVELPGAGIGLIRFRLGEKKVYLFCRMNNESLKKILLTLKEANPNMRFKNLTGVV